MKALPDMITPDSAHRRILPPKVIAQMEHEIVETLREVMEMRPDSGLPFTEEESREVLEHMAYSHDADGLFRGLSGLAEKRKINHAVTIPVVMRNSDPLRIVPGPAYPGEFLPPEEIARMEHEFVQTFSEWMELRAYLQEPFTEREQQELDRLWHSCDCQPNGNSHAYDCAIFLGLAAFAKKRKQQS